MFKMLSLTPPRFSRVRRRVGWASWLATAAIYCAVVLTQAASAAESSLQRQFQHELDLVRAEYRLPGITAAYVLPNGKVGVAATGYADIETHKRMSVRSRMMSGSVGKTFVAATVLALAQEGKLNLDDPISKWFSDRPWFPRLPNHETITIRNLLTHSSGLMDHVYTDAFAHDIGEHFRDPGNPFPPEQLIAYVLDHKPLFQPGKGYSYTDTGYIILGLIIEKVSGHSYYEEVERRFLGPLRLTLTSPSNKFKLPDLASGYISPNNIFRLPRKTTTTPGTLVYNPRVEWTGGGLVTNPRDLVKWVKVLYEGQAMPGRYINDLLDGVPITAGSKDDYYGTGVYIHNPGPFGPSYGHGGWLVGYRTDVRYYPRYRIAIAFQINTDDGLTDRNAPAIIVLRDNLAEIVANAVRH